MAEIDYTARSHRARDDAHRMTDRLLSSERAPVGQLTPQPWMTAAPTQRVVAALRTGGAEVRFVGGCVRDALLNRVNKDIDIATPETPDVVLTRLEDAGIRAIPTGIEHGTVTAVADGMAFEITTLRRDVKTDGRHAEVAFTDDFRADAARRDFTMNALSATPDGRVYDYFDGLADLGARRVRFVGRPHQRIQEDYLRILRFFRFHAHYGEGAPDLEALKACGANVDGLSRLSGERVRDELLKILAAPAPAVVLLDMRGERVLQAVLPEAEHLDTLRVLTWLETRALCLDGIGPDPLRRLGCILETDRDGARAVAERLRLSNEQRDRLTDIAAPPPGTPDPDPEADAAAVRRQVYRRGGQWVVDRALILWAAERVARGTTDSARSRRWVALLEIALTWTPPPLPVKGRDILQKLQVPPGPHVGDLLRQAEAMWLAEDFQPGRDALLERLRAGGASSTEN